MAKVGRGDKDAFGILVHRHVDRLYRYALRLTATPANAEDLVQETWLAVWQNARRYRADKASLPTWIHRVLHNKFIDGRRKQQSEQAALPSAQAPPDQTMTAAEQSKALGGSTEQDPQLLSRLHRLISALPENQRAALALAHLQGFSNKEVAHILGVSVRAAESMLARARRTLRQQLTDELED